MHLHVPMQHPQYTQIYPHHNILIVFGWQNYQRPFQHNHGDITNLEMICVIKTQFDESHHSDLYQVFVRKECETPTSGLLE